MHQIRLAMLSRSFGARPLLAALVSASFILVGCAKAQVGSGTGKDAGGDGRKSGSGGGGTGGIGAGFKLDANLVTPPPVDAGMVQVTVTCDGGEGCKCPPFNVAVIGKPGKWGTNPQGDSDSALQDWLNTSSVGTASVDNITDRPTLTEDLLKKYDVIILASLSEDSTNGPYWTFTDDEVAAFADWVKKGGGVISMSGYSGDGAEVNPLNQLLAFSGITYNKDQAFATCAASSQRVCDCSGSKTLADFVTTDPVVENLGFKVTLIGLENGRSLTAPADAHVAATVPGPKNVLVGALVEKGRVLAYADEWISYTSQWTGFGNPRLNDPGCAGMMPQENYQTAQFWFNMIKWSQPRASCFKIVDSTQEVTIW